ncbi:hypothetical protein B0T16DRAFT_243777 [Cercophora newfieldiana]|uniref:Uncharacterized protein n=1 Tax=Cercophora newfieldiana TaxID=92897 RepID=A0AA40CIC2_9PEZI|nr:hypothetical protein B0T16DRAFT_243777 [Cercophora newfieldiana]
MIARGRIRDSMDDPEGPTNHSPGSPCLARWTLSSVWEPLRRDSDGGLPVRQGGLPPCVAPLAAPHSLRAGNCRRMACHGEEGCMAEEKSKERQTCTRSHGGRKIAMLLQFRLSQKRHPRCPSVFGAEALQRCAAGCRRRSWQPGVPECYAVERVYHGFVGRVRRENNASPPSLLCCSAGSERRLSIAHVCLFRRNFPGPWTFGNRG